MYSPLILRACVGSESTLELTPKRFIYISLTQAVTGESIGEIGLLEASNTIALVEQVLSRRGFPSVWVVLGDRKLQGEESLESLTLENRLDLQFVLKPYVTAVQHGITGYCFIRNGAWDVQNCPNNGPPSFDIIQLINHPDANFFCKSPIDFMGNLAINLSIYVRVKEENPLIRIGIIGGDAWKLSKLDALPDFIAEQYQTYGQNILTLLELLYHCFSKMKLAIPKMADELDTLSQRVYEILQQMLHDDHTRFRSIWSNFVIDEPLVQVRDKFNGFIACLLEHRQMVMCIIEQKADMADRNQEIPLSSAEVMQLVEDTDRLYYRYRSAVGQ